MSDEYTKQLETIIKQMLVRLTGIPLNLVIETISGFKVMPFDRNDNKDRVVLGKLIEVCDEAGRNINVKGINRSRANEVGNDIESFVKDALNAKGYTAYSPTTRSGGRKTVGYPDIEFIDEFGRANYLECKTFNIANIRTTLRSFYLSPSDDFKITKDAHHFVVSFEIYVETEAGSNIFRCKSWKILSIESLLVDVKYEFNSDNARLYAKDLILAEGTL